MTRASRRRVAVLFGGRSVEHEVSIRSARTVIEALDPDRYEAIPVGVTRDGAWRTGADAARLLAGEPDRASGPGRLTLAPDPAFGGLAGPGEGGAWSRLPIDVVFPLIHGGGGEDGSLQGLLELAEIPYVGSGVAASALGMDKRLQRRLFRAAGLPVLTTVEIERAGWESRRVEERRRVLDGVGLPCFVKPAGSGSSVGVGKVKREADLDPLIEDAARYDGWILAEPALDAREIESAVLGNRDPRATPPGEIVPGREFYDYRAKYLEDTSRLLVPAPIDPECSEQVVRMAVEAFRCLGCAGLARVDFFLDKGSGRLLLNEINTLPGFTSISMYPRLWAAEGVSLPALVDRLLEHAFEAHADRRRNRRLLADTGR